MATMKRISEIEAMMMVEAKVREVAGPMADMTQVAIASLVVVYRASGFSARAAYRAAGTASGQYVADLGRRTFKRFGVGVLPHGVVVAL